MSLARVFLAACSLLVSIAADATVVYSYQGNPMTSEYNGTLAPGVTVQLEFSDDGSKLLGWSFGAKGLGIGVEEWSSEESDLSSIVRFRTDAAGSVTAWEVGLKDFRGSGYVDFTSRANMAGSHPLPGYAQDEVRFRYAADFDIYEAFKNPGVWTSTAPLPNLTWVSPVPEASTPSMFWAGLALIASVGTVRRRLGGKTPGRMAGSEFAAPEGLPPHRRRTHRRAPSSCRLAQCKQHLQPRCSSPGPSSEPSRNRTALAWRPRLPGQFTVTCMGPASATATSDEHSYTTDIE